MKTTYITFTREMARAYREDRKRMTRRVMRYQPQPPCDEYILARCLSTIGNDKNIDKFRWIKKHSPSAGDATHYFSCPYGQPGDQLILGTTWAVWDEFDHLKPTQLLDESDCVDFPIWSYFDSDEKPEGFGKLRPGWFLPGFLRDRMPRETLKIVRAERVQDISEADAKAEGAIYGYCDVIDSSASSYRSGFGVLIDSINVRRRYKWEDNYWVWVLGW